MRALVTGGAGFIGSHLVDALLGRGDDVLVIDDFSTGNADHLKSAIAHGARIVEGDVTDREAVERAVSSQRPDVVFHLAAQVDVRISVEEPGRDARINVEGTVLALDAARRAGTDRFVFASSCALYGDPDPASLPLTENAPPRPESPYGQGKLAAEGYVALYRELHGMRAANLRFANVYGPRQGTVGEAGVVSIFARQMHAGETPLVFGTGEQTRDFVYVGDIVAGILAAADRGATGEFNLGTSVETSVLELIEELRTTGDRPDFIPEMRPPRAGEVERMSLEPGLAAAHLGWRAHVPLREGLRRTWEWQCGAAGSAPSAPARSQQSGQSGHSGHSGQSPQTGPRAVAP
ncbi:MAG TPA: NAD-dependent epimerase/dehydratase family protein [Solirubrobacterales bacterium]|nr:NAD-dependent epimerase/dehydratase family protein [Solirubrobacterales bacterium]